jgi:hypothetical protein
MPAFNSVSVSPLFIAAFRYRPLKLNRDVSSSPQLTQLTNSRFPSGRPPLPLASPDWMLGVNAVTPFDF